MRKRILGLVALAAIAAPIAFASSANAATTDVDGVVTVDKGEIMAQFLGMNEKAFQKIAMADGQSLTGSNVFTATTTTGVGCSDGTVQNHCPQHPSSPARSRSPRSTTARLTRSPAGHLGAKGASVITESNTYGTARRAASRTTTPSAPDTAP